MVRSVCGGNNYCHKNALRKLALLASIFYSLW